MQNVSMLRGRLSVKRYTLFFYKFRVFGISHPKSRISHPYITNLLQRYDIIKEWICISKNQRKVGGHYEDSGL